MMKNVNFHLCCHMKFFLLKIFRKFWYLFPNIDIIQLYKNIIKKFGQIYEHKSAIDIEIFIKFMITFNSYAFTFFTFNFEGFCNNFQFVRFSDNYWFLYQMLYNFHHRFLIITERSTKTRAKKKIVFFFLVFILIAVFITFEIFLYHLMLPISWIFDLEQTLRSCALNCKINTYRHKMFGLMWCPRTYQSCWGMSVGWQLVA